MAWQKLKIEVEKPYSILSHFHNFSILHRPIPCVVDIDVFRRIIPVGEEQVPVKVYVEESDGLLKIFWYGRNELSLKIRRIIEHIFSVDVSYNKFVRFLQDSPILLGIARKYAGLRPSRSLNLYEALIKVVLQQRISLKIALITTAKLVERYGYREEIDGVYYYSFPNPEALRVAGVERIKALGITMIKARSIVEIAEYASAGNLPAGRDIERDPKRVIDELMDIYGIGMWTAELAVAMVKHDFSIGPAGDLNVVKGCRSILGIKGENEIREFFQRFGKWRGLLMYLLALEMKSI